MSGLTFLEFVELFGIFKAQKKNRCKIFKWKYNYITSFCLLQVLKKDICLGVQTATEFLVMSLVLRSVLSFSVVEFCLEMNLILLRKRKTSLSDLR